MSMKEKYGSFLIKDILFYDEIEREHFLTELNKSHKKYISKVNGKKVVGHGRFKILSGEEKSNLKALNMQLTIDEENNIVTVEGYGHRNLIFPIEMYTRKLFDEGRIVSYEATDNLRRNYGVFDEAVKEMEEFYKEEKRRIELFKKGELEPPAYRAEEEKKVK